MTDQPQPTPRGFVSRERLIASWPLIRKVLLVACMAALCTLFFGFCVPFLLLGLKVLPSLSYAGVIYVFVGGLFGLLFGGITSAISLGRSERPVTRYYAALFITLAILSAAYYVAYMNIDSLQHI